MDKPLLTILNINNLTLSKYEVIKELENVQVFNLKYSKTKELYGVRHMRVLIHDKKNKLKFQSKTFTYFITTYIKNAILNCKKEDRITIDQLSSKEVNYPTINVWIGK